MRPRIVIVGAGFGGIAAARALKRAEADILLIDRTNHHLFQPLLYQVATAALSPADIATATRVLLRGQHNATVIMAEVVGVDTTDKALNLADGRSITFDYLCWRPALHIVSSAMMNGQNIHRSSNRSMTLLISANGCCPLSSAPNNAMTGMR